MLNIKWKQLIGLLVVMLLFVGCGSDKPNNKVKPDEKPLTEQQTNRPDRSENKVQIKLYFATSDAMNVAIEIFECVPADNTPEKAVEKLVQGPRNSLLLPVFPQGTELLGLYVKNGTAFVNFNSLIKKNYMGGSSGEILLTTALVNTLTEFPNITRVQILVEGKKITTIGGHLEVLEPLRRVESMIRKSSK